MRRLTGINKGITAAALVGCVGLLGTGITQAAPAPVTVNWYYPEENSYIPANQAQVQAAVDRITEKAIDVKVNLVPIISSDYQQKLSVMLETGQATGIVWTSGREMT